MKKAIIVLGLGLLSACGSLSDAIMPGYEMGICEQTPEKCASASAANHAASESKEPVPTITALSRGDATRVWLAPYRGTNGVLTKSGFVYFSQ